MAQSIPNDCRLIEDAFKHVLAYESTICEQICIIDLAVSAILLHLLRNATLPPPPTDKIDAYVLRKPVSDGLSATLFGQRLEKISCFLGEGRE
jgi:hypothetical protein